MATINGTANDDTLDGTAAADTINGLGGKDRISGKEGNDILRGDEGDDDLDGGLGDDVVEGGAGNDILRGNYYQFSGENEGHDQLLGGDGDDLIISSYSQSFVVDGGAGSDRWSYGFWDRESPITIDAGLFATDAGWTLGDDIIVRGIEIVSIGLTSGDDTFINHTAGTRATISMGSGADEAYVSDGRSAISDSPFFDDEGIDRIVIDFSGAAAGLRSVIEDFDSLPDYETAYYKLWEGADYETATRAVSTFGFDVVSITGSRFADQIIGTDGRDQIWGGDGNDELTALLGNDSLDGGAGSDTLNLDLRPFANDSPANTLRYILSGATIDLALTGAQALPVQRFFDHWAGGVTEHLHGRVTLRSIENISGTGLADQLHGDDQANRLTGRGGHDVLSGRAGDDRLTGDGGDDMLAGGGGADLLSGGAGIDTVSYRFATAAVRVDLGAAGAQDTLAGGLDTLSGFENAIGGSAGDRLVGTDAANRLDGEAGADTMVGRLGNDVYVVDDSGDRAIEYSALGGIDTVRSSADFTLGQRVENLVLTGEAAINGTGNGAANAITGNGAANVLRGEGSNDVLAGAGGDDSLFGGVARDTLIGGAGEDDFCFDTSLGWNNQDWLGDFHAGDDTIMLDRDVFSEIGNGTLSESAFHAGKAAADENDRIVYNEATGRIFYDADGAGGAAAIFFARVEAGTTLTHADFVGYI
jgi:Ca2+-binding RTX toxin-like protein